MNEAYGTPRRMNWFDWLLVSLVGLAIAAGFFGIRWAMRRSEGASGVVTYTLVLRDWQFSAPEVGASVRSQNGTVALGEVVEVQASPHRFSAIKDGEIVIAESEERRDYLLTVRSDGSLREGDGLRVGDVRIAAGMTVGMRIGNLLVTQAKIGTVEWEASDA